MATGGRISSHVGVNLFCHTCLAKLLYFSRLGMSRTVGDHIYPARVNLICIQALILFSFFALKLLRTILTKHWEQ
jgi:hypothetical protein